MGPVLKYYRLLDHNKPRFKACSGEFGLKPIPITSEFGKINFIQDYPADCFEARCPIVDAYTANQSYILVPEVTQVLSERTPRIIQTTAFYIARPNNHISGIEFTDQ